jgi:hypothetical protein
MCVFVNTLRPEVALRVWDIFLNEGSKVLFRIAAALFQINEPKLLAAKDASDLFSLLRNMGKDVIDADALIAVAYKGYSPHASLSRVVTSNLSPRYLIHRKSSLDNTADGTTRPQRAMTAGSLEVANPRLRANNKQHTAVPADLIGIGLAHMGPDKCPQSALLRTDAYSENIAYVESVGTIGEPTGHRASFDSSNSKSPAGKGSSPSGKFGTAFADGNTLLSRDGSGVLFTSPGKERRSSVGSDRNSFSSASGRPRSVKQFTPLQVAAEQLHYEAYLLQYPHKSPGTRKKGKHKTLSFSRADIALWRSSFRPALEEQYKLMEEARQEWRQEASTGRYSDVLRKSDFSTPSKAAQDPTQQAKLAPECSTGTLNTALADSEEDN